jgi:hypothetical protein
MTDEHPNADYRNRAERAEQELAEVTELAGELADEATALRTAVCFNTPPKLFNGVECYEARIPVEFVSGLTAALAAWNLRNLR